MKCFHINWTMLCSPPPALCSKTEEARAEALHLMGNVSNLCTPKNGELVIHATQVLQAVGTPT